MSATLFWKLSNQPHINVRIQKNLEHILRVKPELKHLFANATNKVEHFFNLFFPTLEAVGYVANLSLEDDSSKKINLSLRVPAHPEFSEYFDSHNSFAVIGYWNMTTNSPWFTPEKIIITHNNHGPTVYEHELECNYQKLEVDEFPGRNIVNVLNRQLANDLPKISVLTNQRLKDWSSFLQFKRQLIQQKTVGLRYITHEYNHQKSSLKLLVVAQDAAYLAKAYQSFSRQNLQLFDLNISDNEWKFILPEKDNDKKVQKASLELGQIARGKKALQEISLDQLSKSDIEIMKESEFSFEGASYAWLNVELNEDWKNKLDGIDTHSGDAEVMQSNQDILDSFYKKIPKQGFISFSLIGDWALVKRHEWSIKNLKQNENCYSPYLSSYLFDITQANEPFEIQDVDHWYNQELNPSQQNAVKKMLSAPDLCLIQGPPGTGKTTVIAEAILQFAKNGQTVLLASQAHDAIDNALSRIKNKPELRAIRLAKESKGRSKITDEGKQFAGEQALARHYDALSEDIDQRFLTPFHHKKKQIDTLKLWVSQAEFLSADVEGAQNKLRNIKALGLESADRMNAEQQVFNQAYQHYETMYKQTQELTQLRDFLQQEGKVASPLSADIPPELHGLVENLFSMAHAQVKLPFDMNDFKHNVNAQMLILKALFDHWFEINSFLPQIKHDIQRLEQAGTDRLISVETQLKITALEKEVAALADQMEESDADEIVDLWRKKRKEMSALKQTESGLTHECYQLFSDADQFIRIDHAKEQSLVLKQRVDVLTSIGHTLKLHLVEAITGLNTRLENTRLVVPNEQALKDLQAQIESLRSEYQVIQTRLNMLEQQQQEHLRKQNFDAHFNFVSAVSAAQQQLNSLEENYQKNETKIQIWQPLFEKWQAILKDQSQAAQDWELLRDVYTQHCNLVAISCNEREQTLADAGFDGFDVVIIDEVSKATPLELLMPLMRARKAILVGDHRQLPPLFQESQDESKTLEDMVNEDEENVASDNNLLTKENFKRYENMVTASLFKDLFEKAPESLRERLTVQFRMHPQIMKMINYFYEGQLSCGNPTKDRQHFVTLRSKNNNLISEQNHLLWVDTSYDEKGAVCLDVEGSTNPTEARLIAQTLVEINAQMRGQGFTQKSEKGKLKVGVVSFYQSQCRVIREAIKHANRGQLKFDAIDVEINTVIRYQGKEKPIILMSLVRNDGRSKTHRRSSHANVARFEFINVAMSRAQNLLVVFGARNMLEMRDVILPNMDSEGSSKKKVYQDIFNRLDREAMICSPKELMQACSH